MRTSVFAFGSVVLASLTSLVAASPIVLRNKLDCPSIPSTADDNVLKQVYQITQSRGASDLVLLATFETAWVETHVNNLPCGDQDSIGVFQQRPSQGWGTYDQIMDVNYSTNKFLDSCIPIAAANPTARAGTIAQMVQRSEFPDRYNENEGTANDLIARARELTGGGGGGGGGGSCKTTYTVASGDSCYSIGQQFGVSSDQIIAWNSGVNSGCTNLQPGQSLCVAM